MNLFRVLLYIQLQQARAMKDQDTQRAIALNDAFYIVIGKAMEKP